MRFRILLILTLSAMVVRPLYLRADESAVEFLRNFVEDVEAARSLFPTVNVEGECIFQSKVIAGKPGLASRGQASNSAFKRSFQYMHKDFGLSMRIISISEPGASPGHDFDTRVVNTPIYSLHVDDDKTNNTGYIQTAITSYDHIENFIACFWIPDENIQGMVPGPSMDHSMFSLESIEDGSKKCIVAFSPDVVLTLTVGKYGNNFLPTNYTLTNGSIIVTQHSWVWETLPSGSHYPKKFISQSRLTYPAQMQGNLGEAVELIRTEVEFQTVTENPVLTDEDFTFTALGLEPGSIVYDKRDAKETRFEFQPQSGSLLGLVEKPIPDVERTIQRRLPRPFNWLRMVSLGAVVVLSLGAFGYFLRSRAR